jgi:hypothetical protein
MKLLADAALEDHNKLITNENQLINAVKTSANVSALYVNMKALKNTNSIEQVQSYEILDSLEGSFTILVNGNPLCFDATTSVIRLNQGTPITFGIFDSTTVYNNRNGRVALFNTANRTALRHAGFVCYSHKFLPNNWDFSWFIKKTSEGSTYELYNDFYGRNMGATLCYDTNNDLFFLGLYDDSRRCRVTFSGTIPNKFLTPHIPGLNVRFCKNLYFGDYVPAISSYNDKDKIFETVCYDIGSLYGATGFKIWPNMYDRYTVELKGYFRPDATGWWNFFLTSKDASYMWIGPSAVSGFTTDNAFIKNPGLHPMLTKDGYIYLFKDVYYFIRIIFGDNVGPDDVRLEYIKPGQRNRTIASNLFYLNQP